ncbi:MAG: protein kinase [Planctomycetes bacterium]|nr:protein kinase [Planctomycetota bacterium]
MSSSASASSPSSTSSRRKVGEIALQKGYINRTQLKEALSAQGELQKLGLSEKIGQILYQKKFITQNVLDEILKEQDAGGGPRRVLGNFEIHEKIGQGAMGVVFKARQISMDRVVALKILSPKYANDAEFIERFVREARAAGQFNHEHIVAAVDVGYVEPYHYFAMEHVQGINLRQAIRERGKLPEREALELTRQVALALDHALSKGIIHRDIKPDNVMLTERGMAKLLDLGLATAVAAESQSRADMDAVNEGEAAGGKKDAAAKRAVGTPHYMSPEAARGIEDLDTRADIYSLGCTLYHLLTGSTPFDGSRSREVMLQHATQRVPDVRERAPGLSAHTAKIVAKMTAQEREERYANPKELAEDLEAAAAGRAPLHAQGKASGKSGAHPNYTTGPRKPIAPNAKTTGPRAPVRGRGTTGPRVPVAGRPTTGPAAPVAGDRTGGISVTIGSSRGTAGAPPAQAKNKGAVAAVVVIALVGIGLAVGLGMGGKDDARQARREPVPPAPEPQPARAPVAEPIKPLGAPQPAEPSGAELAQRALQAYEQLKKDRPHDYPALNEALERARPLAAGTPTLEAFGAAEAALKADWEARIARALDPMRAAAGAAVANRDFDAARKALEEGALAAELRVFDWQARLQTARKEAGARMEADAANLWKRAQALAAGGGEKELAEGIDLAAQAAALPADWAPTSQTAAAALPEWRKKLEAAKAQAQQAQLAAREAARGLVDALVKDLEPMLRQNRFAQALELVEQKSREGAYQPVREDLAREAADLKAILALRDAAVAAMNAKTGERVALKKGGTTLQGVIADSAGRPGVTLRLEGKMELTVSAAQLEAADVDAYAAAPHTAAEGAAIGATPAEAHRRRGLLFLAAGDFAKAKAHFIAARDGGLGVAVQPYLERLVAYELGEAELLAQRTWQKAEQQFQAQAWKDARGSYEAFQNEHGKSQEFAKRGEELKARLAHIDGILNPNRPGLWATYFKGMDHKPENVALQRVDPQIVFAWGGGGPADQVGSDQFSARWEGFIKIEKGGSYTFTGYSDDGIRLWIGDKLVLEFWQDRARMPTPGSIDLPPGLYPLRVDYYENGGGADCELRWALAGGFDEQAVPAAALWHRPPAGVPKNP